MSHTNTILTDSEKTWINECSRRLRIVQADGATAPPEKRQEYLNEEIDQSLKAVPTADRKRYLEALMARFPIGESVTESSSPSSFSSPPAGVTETPEQLLEQFLMVAAKLPEEKRKVVSKQLHEAGLSWIDRDASPLEISQEARLKLGLLTGQQPRLSRVVELAVFLVDEMCLLDANALKTMRELSPRSPLLKRSEDFRKTVSRYLTSDNETLDSQWQSIRGLLGGLLAATQGGCKSFGRQFVEHLSPNAIEDTVVGEGSRVFGPNKKERCWDKYKDLAGDYATPDLVDRRVKDCLAVFVEKLLVDKR
jgi:hypothetical protein